ncbi:uncharacterized protein LOC131210511 [Anopheles bellator]|uniref:uncharacterized protein LOC131210511 n=1 Tax=Anopheles bellator TaxID=139047 RepID=UPI0026485C89|nr:uncharacterized protein LOC131210511 [Anopheles bellator]
MSKTLVKKAFLLAEEGLPFSKPQTDVKTNKRKASALELIPRHQKLVELVGKKGHKVEKDIIRRREKLTISDIRHQIANRHDPTEDNVRRLLLLSNSSTLDEETRKKILKRAQTGHTVTKVNLSKTARRQKAINRKGRKNRPDESEEPAADEPEGTGESVFTEDDFANFAQELAKSGL